jgi:hypothetical protein
MGILFRAPLVRWLHTPKWPRCGEWATLRMVCTPGAELALCRIRVRTVARAQALFSLSWDVASAQEGESFMGHGRAQNRAVPVQEGDIDIAQTGEPYKVTGWR